MIKKLNPEDLELLKKPFGTLILDKDITKEGIASILVDATKIISVGDATTARMVSFDLIPDLAVIDGKERRIKQNYPAKYEAAELQCVNPSGTISDEAVAIIRTALNLKPPVRVVVDGEEDMLALPVFTLAPIGSVVLYGQPLRGVVAVKITLAKQEEANKLMARLS